MKKARSDAPTSDAQTTAPALDQLARLTSAAALPDARIDLSDPDAPAIKDWSGAERGKFCRPVKKQKTLRIDADVLAFFEAGGPGYQSRMNSVLRQAMVQGLGGERAVQMAPGEKVMRQDSKTLRRAAK